jgi:hypothetical protein
MRLINLISNKNRPLSLGLGVTTAGLRHSIRAIRDPQPPFSAGPGAGAGFRSVEVRSVWLFSSWGYRLSIIRIRATKEGEVSRLAGVGSYKKAYAEIEKCIPLCSNCHRILHWDEHRA